MHKRFTAWWALAAALVVAGCTTTPETATESMQTAQHFQKKLTHTAQLDYLLFLPAGYAKSGTKPWPLLLFLHGAGERGTNLAKVAVHGPPKIVKAKKDFPFVLVSPQCPTDRTWRDDELLALLDDVVAKHNIDTNRIYLTGLSMGGYGSWSLGTKYRNALRPSHPFAAAVSNCRFCWRARTGKRR